MRLLLLLLIPTIVLANPRTEVDAFINSIKPKTNLSESTNTKAYVAEPRASVQDRKALEQAKQNFNDNASDDSALRSKLNNSIQHDKTKDCNMLMNKNNEALDRYGKSFIKEQTLKQNYDLQGIIAAASKNPYKLAKTKSSAKFKAKTYTCDETAIPTTKICTKTLVLKPIPQPNKKHIVTVMLSHHSRDYSEFLVDLKTGKVSSHYNRRDIRNTLAPVINKLATEPRQVELRHWIVNNDIDLRVLQQPTKANNYITRLAIKQNGADTSSMRRSRRREAREKRDRERGIIVSWEVEVKQKPLLKETWVDNCQDLKKLSKLCKEVNKKHLEIEKTKTIAGYPDLVTKPYWGIEYEYQCGIESKSNCDKYIAQGCVQIDSKVAKVIDDIPISYKNTYSCGDSGYSNFNETTDFLKPFESEADSGYGAADFANVAVAAGIVDEMRKAGADGIGGVHGSDNPNVFRGKPYYCKVTGGRSIKDCCNLKGMFCKDNLLFKGCKESARLATASLKEKRCHLVARRYCSKRVKLGFTKFCVQWKDSYCCFGSELARIVHEIARDDSEQIALHQYNRAHGVRFDWGQDDNPNCVSLTAKQLSLINFNTKFAANHLASLAKSKQEELAKSIQAKFQAAHKNINAKQVGLKMQQNMKNRTARFGEIKDKRAMLEGQ